jgi:lipoate-protein ligase A
MEEAVSGGPRLFFYTWPKPVLVLGYGQPESDVDLNYCRARGIPVHRRASGGTGVLHWKDLAVSLALPMSHPKAKGIQGLYDFMKTSLCQALEMEKIPVTDPGPAPGRGRARSPLCYLDHSSETLLLDGKKCVGCSQARKKDAGLVHATLMLNLDAALTSKVFRMPEAKILQAIAPIPLPPEHHPSFKERLGEIIRSAL